MLLFLLPSNFTQPYGLIQMPIMLPTLMENHLNLVLDFQDSNFPQLSPRYYSLHNENKCPGIPTSSCFCYYRFYNDTDRPPPPSVRTKKFIGIAKSQRRWQKTGKDNIRSGDQEDRESHHRHVLFSTRMTNDFCVEFGGEAVQNNVTGMKTITYKSRIFKAHTLTE